MCQAFGTWVFKGKGWLRDRTKTQHAKKATGKTKNAPRKPRRFGRQTRFRQGRPFLQLRHVKTNQQIEVAIDDIGSRGDGVARIQGHLMFAPRNRIGERVRVRIRSVSEKFALTERA
jgi:predicted RNA-binding protein with TRAM domain